MTWNRCPRSAEYAVRRIQQELAAQRLKAKQLQRSGQPATHHDVQQARDARDALWHQLRDGKATLPSVAPPFEAAIARADQLADQRYTGASESAALEHATDSIEQIELRCSDYERAITELTAQLDTHRSVWAEQMQAIGLAEASPAQYLTWSEQRRHALQLAEKLLETEVERAQLTDAQTAATDELRASLTEQGVAVAPSLTFAELVVHAATIIRHAEQSDAQRAALRRQRDASNVAAKTLETRAQRSRQLMGEWEQAWAKHLAAARLPADTVRPAVSQALLHFTALASCLKDARELRKNRIEAMQRDLQTFADAGRELAAALAPELLAEPPERIAAELQKRLLSARSAMEKRDAANAQLSACRTQMQQAQRQRDEAQSRLAPLMRMADVQDSAALNAAVERSERANALDKAIEESRRACLESGDGLTLEQLEAEYRAEEGGAVAVQLTQLQLEWEQSAKERDRLLTELTTSEVALHRYTGGPDAADAESRRQQALAAMALAVERYIKITIAARLLRWSIDRYREQKQDPLLRRAGELFATLTCGSFERLRVEFEEEIPHLMGCRPNGKLVDITGMSDGTCDQLYLALRLAALELQFDQHRVLPFIADDLFINFDEARAAAGFKAFAALARKTQVIFLSHHPHLVPIAEKAIGEPVNVLTLSGAGS